jgi:oligopeptide transport system substrate-binding protein
MVLKRVAANSRGRRTRRPSKGVGAAVIAVVVLAAAMCCLLFAGVAGGAEIAGATTLGGTLNVGIAEPWGLEPMFLADADSTQVGQALFDSLTAYDPLTNEVIPAAAASWETNDDATVWTFHLVQGATFHDGSPVTAGDFIYSWNRLWKLQPDLSYLLGAVASAKRSTLSGLRAKDDYTLEVTLSYPYADFATTVAHPALAPVPKAYVQKNARQFAEAPIGNGPFKMSGVWNHNQSIHLIKYAGYYGDRPNIDGVSFTIFPDDDAAFAAFRGGTLDLSNVPVGELQECKKEYGVSHDGYTAQPGKQTLLGPVAATWYVLFNMDDPLLQNADLRRAISLAIDRERICTAATGGMYAPADNLIPPGVPGYEAGAWAYSAYDPAQAEAALAAAGYPQGEGLPTIELLCGSWNNYPLLMTAIKEDLAAVGIEANLTVLDLFYDRKTPGFADLVFGRQFQVAHMSWIADFPLIDNFLRPLLSTAGSDNYGGYSNPLVDDALALARAMTDASSRMAAFQQINRQIGEECPVVPIGYYRTPRVASERVHDLICSSMGLPDFTQVWIR